jgi:hypothetical protein
MVPAVEHGAIAASHAAAATNKHSLIEKTSESDTPNAKSVGDGRELGHRWRRGDCQLDAQRCQANRERICRKAKCFPALPEYQMLNTAG